ncbi:electron transfer flavoprotein subunit beta [Sphaerisporangium krabiense]|uniref:Electron transfer flavoprotein subunit beta n=1 Tax=Sphaerisporangium krabiense TaxID=763782 RepID=A0A7W8Z2Q4_9ACTN|nr:electron transfer flavoprotein subunit beta/FixA family protein [Sphaerisporangium krabiense]MBB5626160.1 electron transfer flavoprotein beta subunit [Sphaerisporangium krabiense]GII66173.1 electron transfer flavoprotein subunit beta [Sphaerisporangium krabiense]
MKIVVCVKYVPDMASQPRFTPGHRVDRAGGQLSELDEYAVEQALRVVESVPGAHVTHLTAGPPAAAEALRKALAMGGDAAVHVSDEAIAGSDGPATALVLAAALRRLAPDLVVCAMASTDGGTSLVPAMLAEHLDMPQLTFAGEVSVADGAVRIRRDAAGEIRRMEGALPAVVSVTDRIGDPRYPSFKGIMAAKKKSLETWTLADLGVPADQVGAAARTVVEDITARPARTAGTIVKDEGEGGRSLAGFLSTRKFI